MAHATKIGRPKKTDSGPITSALRSKGFVVELAERTGIVMNNGIIDFKKLSREIEDPIRNIHIPVQSLKNWHTGKYSVGDYNFKLINQRFLGLTNWFETETLPASITGILNAVDLNSSKIKSPVRTLDLSSTRMNVGTGLTEIFTRWAPQQRILDDGTWGDYFIPKIQLNVPLDRISESYRPSDLLSIIELLISVGNFLDDEISDQDFLFWALDLASATILVRAHINAMSEKNKRLSGLPGDYSTFFSRIFFSECLGVTDTVICDFISRISGRKNNELVAANILRAISHVNLELSRIDESLKSISKLFLKITNDDRIFS